MNPSILENNSDQKSLNKARISFVDRILTNYYRQKWRGFSRIWSFVQRNSRNSNLRVINKYGAIFNLNPHAYIDSHVVHSGYYESEVLEAVLPFLDAEAIFWDIGSNFGLHAITAKYMKPQSRVICIEPSSSMLSRCQENCRLNNLEIETINIALSDSPKFQSLHLAKDGNPGMSTLKPWQEATYDGTMTCWCDSGDNLVSNHILPEPTVIKLDVEGSELEVLMGMVNIINNNILKAIVFEESCDFLKNKDSEIYNILVQAGFDIHILSRKEHTNHNLENFIATR